MLRAKAPESSELEKTVRALLASTEAQARTRPQGAARACMPRHLEDLKRDLSPPSLASILKVDAPPGRKKSFSRKDFKQRTDELQVAARCALQTTIATFIQADNQYTGVLNIANSALKDRPNERTDRLEREASKHLRNSDVTLLNGMASIEKQVTDIRLFLTTINEYRAEGYARQARIGAMAAAREWAAVEGILRGSKLEWQVRLVELKRERAALDATHVPNSEVEAQASVTPGYTETVWPAAIETLLAWRKYCDFRRELASPEDESDKINLHIALGHVQYLIPHDTELSLPQYAALGEAAVVEKSFDSDLSGPEILVAEAEHVYQAWKDVCNGVLAVAALRTGETDDPQPNRDALLRLATMLDDIVDAYDCLGLALANKLKGVSPDLLTTGMRILETWEYRRFLGALLSDLGHAYAPYLPPPPAAQEPPQSGKGRKAARNKPGAREKKRAPQAMQVAGAAGHIVPLLRDAEFTHKLVADLNTFCDEAETLKKQAETKLRLQERALSGLRKMRLIADAATCYEVAASKYEAAGKLLDDAGRMSLPTVSRKELQGFQESCLAEADLNKAYCKTFEGAAFAEDWVRKLDGSRRLDVSVPKDNGFFRTMTDVRGKDDRMFEVVLTLQPATVTKSREITILAHVHVAPGVNAAHAATLTGSQVAAAHFKTEADRFRGKRHEMRGGATVERAKLKDPEYAAGLVRRAAAKETPVILRRGLPRTRASIGKEA